MPAEGDKKFDELKKKDSKGVELRGKTFGIVGFGRIGQNVAKMALGLGMKVVAFDPFVKEADVLIDIEGVANTVVNEERARYALEPQLIGYLGGEAGSGKSAVIEALLIFATRWGRRNAIETLAFTGIAAIQADGKTIHSGRNIEFGKYTARSPPCLGMRDAFAQVYLTIFD